MKELEPVFDEEMFDLEIWDRYAYLIPYFLYGQLTYQDYLFIRGRIEKEENEGTRAILC